MRRPPPLNTCLAYPITTSVAAFAIMATLMFWNGSNISNLEIGLDDWWKDPWRFFTPVLFHGDVIHLTFNLIMFWIFGTQIEAVFGPGRTLGIYALFAAGSSAAEVAIFQGGIGLSGVVYGQFGLLWILSRTDPRFQDSVDKQLVQWLVGWFFFCILATVTNVMHVANVAHGIGCILGALLGWTISARDSILRSRNTAILTFTFLLCMAGATVARPYVNLSSRYVNELFQHGLDALKNNNTNRAISLYEKAVIANPKSSDCWNNLGCAYFQADRKEEARLAFQKSKMLEKERQ